MSQTATLEEQKAVSTITDLCALATRVPLYHLAIIDEARTAEVPAGVGGLGRVPDIRELALGEPAPEITEAAFEKIQDIEVVVAASEQIVNGFAADSPRFEDIRTAIREVVGRVREYGRATIGQILSLNEFDFNANAVTAAAFKALAESAERLGELSQVPIGSRSPIAASGNGQNQSAPDSPAGDNEAKSLKPSEEKAFQSYVMAESAIADRCTDDDAYDWLDENLDKKLDYKLPGRATWKRQVSAGRKFYDAKKNNPRGGRKPRA